MSDIEHIRPAQGLDTFKKLQYSQAVRVGDLVFVSGQAAWDENFGVPEDFEAECRSAFENLKMVLETAGCTLADVVEATSLHAPGTDLMAFWKVRNEFMAAPWPAWTTIGGVTLAFPNMRVEVKATAVRRTG